ncbi:hypothetical protein NSA47_02185 [Irregularibacter muris]|uniref:Uncharacterized protein n=1 Tax=Irregularibacter muris TaxID=1796619 RepID=A0AAE3KZ72_9FIRM|nr:hypothetical protein [Irregularibacter muris]MCR1897797.1 hypothetical protein [Irregularibacter muris]
MKKHYISFFIIVTLVAIGILSFVIIQNKAIENQPKKAKLVMDIGGRRNGEWGKYDIFTTQRKA